MLGHNESYSKMVRYESADKLEAVESEKGEAEAMMNLASNSKVDVSKAYRASHDLA